MAFVTEGNSHAGLNDAAKAHDVAGTPSPAESGFVSELHIPPGGDQN
jgi:hypothetical protein